MRAQQKTIEFWPSRFIPGVINVRGIRSEEPIPVQMTARAFGALVLKLRRQHGQPERSRRQGIGGVVYQLTYTTSRKLALTVRAMWL